MISDENGKASHNLNMQCYCRVLNSAYHFIKYSGMYSFPASTVLCQSCKLSESGSLRLIFLTAVSACILMVHGLSGGSRDCAWFYLFRIHGCDVFFFFFSVISFMIDVFSSLFQIPG